MQACDNKMPMDFIQELVVEAAVLQIDREKLFVDMSRVLAAATCWQERAAKVFAHRGQMSEFEDIMRSAAEISVILPSLADVEDAVLMAKSWLKNSEPFLLSSSSMAPGSCPVLKLEALKGLILQSKSLKISLEEQRMLEIVLKNCEEWEKVAYSALQDVQCLCNASSLGDGKDNGLIMRIEVLIARIESITKSGCSLVFDFAAIPKLQNAHSMLLWCTKVFSFCPIVPSFEDVENLMKTAEDFSGTCVSGLLWSSLIDGVKWLRKALGIIPVASNFERCKLSDAEEFLAESKARDISFPAVVDQLVYANQKHKVWQEQVHQFFCLKSQEQTWSVILELKELGMAVAFGCPELDMVLSEVKRVEKWKQQSVEILERFVGNGRSLPSALQQIIWALEKALHYIAGKSQSYGARNLCMCCAGYIEDQEFTTCSMCHDHYHLQCVGSALGDLKNAGLYICPYCCSLVDGSVYQEGGGPLRFGRRRPELKMLVELLSNAENLSIRVEEEGTLQLVVKQVLEYKTCLREILDSALSSSGRNLNVITEKLIAAFKASKVAGVYDDQDNDDLDLALGRNLWRINVNRSFEALEKPTMHQIHQHIEEGLAISTPCGDYFWQKLTDLEHIGSQWADQARKVATDSGALGLDKVFKLITQGENLPVVLEKELKLLRARTMLYCICRKPYDDRAKVVCNQCDEWYHVECMKLLSMPEMFVCAACNPEAERLSMLPLTDHERSTGAKLLEPRTPSPRHTKSRMKHSITKFGLKQNVLATTKNQTTSFSRYDKVDRLQWQTRKPFRRAARRRSEFESLSQFIHIQQ
uniref:Lysine-specific demethylase rbr-2 n=1 Tax=Rhizophora mucronata TaxID=61149 RepID=A0A2P2MIU6_RHIMU